MGYICQLSYCFRELMGLVDTSDHMTHHMMMSSVTLVDGCQVDV